MSFEKHGTDSAEGYQSTVTGNIDICPKCGYEGEAVPEKRIRKKDWAIGILTAGFGGFGFAYLAATYFLRADEAKRATVCPSCKSVIRKATKKGGDVIPDKEAIGKAKATAKAIAKDPRIRSSVRKMGRSLKDLQDSFDV